MHYHVHWGGFTAGESGWREEKVDLHCFICACDAVGSYLLLISRRSFIEVCEWGRIY